MPRSAAMNHEVKRAFGGLLPLIDTPELRDVLIQVRDGRAQLWADFGSGLRQYQGWATDAATVHRLAVQLIAAGGRHVDELHPCADVRLGEGIRVHAMLPPACVTGAAISIRVPRPIAPSFESMVNAGLCAAQTAELLHTAAIERNNIIISGSTGSGKTTLLASLLDLAGQNERIVTIEDVSELRLTHQHWVALEARQANTEGVGELTLDRLLREALRMRPDRIALGECRGAEVLTLLSALNTGHNGGAGTLHASTVHDVPARLEALAALGGLHPGGLARQAQSALHLVVHVSRAADGTHRIEALGQFHVRHETLEVKELT